MAIAGCGSDHALGSLFFTCQLRLGRSSQLATQVANYAETGNKEYKMKMIRNMALSFDGKFYATQGGPLRPGYSVSEAQLPTDWETRVIS